MYSVGIDIIEIDRVAAAAENPRFVARVFGEEERHELEARGWKRQNLAAAFAAKEAFAKAIGTGVRGFALSAVQLLHGELGAPYLRLGEDARIIAEVRGYTRFSVSVSHSRDNAVAAVIASGE